MLTLFPRRILPILGLVFFTVQHTVATPVISGFMASNASLLAYEDGAFPAIILPPSGYLMVFDSNKDRRDPARPLHPNFSLNSQGKYLALIAPDEVTVATEFASRFPAQPADFTYGLVPGTNGAPTAHGFLAKPTPSTPSAKAASAMLPQTVGFSRAAGVFQNSFTLQLNGAGANQRIRYLVIPASAGNALTEPTASSPAYSSPITISSSVIVKAAVFSEGDTSKGATATTYYAKLDASLGAFASKLPVIALDSMGSGPITKESDERPSWFYSFAPTASGSSLLSSPTELTSPASISVRGSSSATFPKKNYNLKFTDATGDKQKQTPLGVPAAEHWALVGAWKYDQSHINNALVYSLSNRIGRWAPRTRFAEVFINSSGNDLDTSDYAGVYTLTERIEVDDERVDLKTLEPGDLGPSEITGGYIFKIDTKSHDDVAWQTTRTLADSARASVILVAPKPESAAPAQIDYLRTYVQRMENALYSDQAGGWAQRTYLDYIDRAFWVDHHILNTFAANPDAFVRSAYFNKERNGRLRAGPVWDFDRALGSEWDERSFRWDVWSGLGATDVWRTGWWGILATDPEFMQDWIDRWQSLRRGALSHASLIAQVTTLSGQIGPEAAARDSARWPDNRSSYGSYTGQIEHMKGWVTVRAQWIDSQFLAAPAITTANGFVTFTAPVGARLAYTLDGSDPRALGGGVAPNAILAASPLSLPAAANFHVRSYRAELRGTFPGSPWSSALGGEASSPLAPQSRIINLSSRAFVGSGENALFSGIVVADTESKRYLARAVGPGLAAFGATGLVPHPQLMILSATGTELFRNTGWETGTDATRLPGYARSAGAFPLVPGVRDSALSPTFASGTYNFQISAATNQPGLGLAELYELDANGRTVNLSTRARVRTGDGALIGGFVIQGSAHKRILVRAVGPTLAAFSLGDVLHDPVLAIYSGQTIIATNDRWELGDNPAAIATAAAQAGAFALPARSEDAALLVTLPPGAYTIEVKGKAETEGIALLEIYEIP